MEDLPTALAAASESAFEHGPWVTRTHNAICRALSGEAEPAASDHPG